MSTGHHRARRRRQVLPLGRRHRATGARRRRLHAARGRDRRAARASRARARSTLAAHHGRPDRRRRRQRALSRPAAVRRRRAAISMVFQSFALFPWLTVQQNVELGLEARGVGRAERARARRGGDQPDRPGRLRRRAAARAVGRHAPARGHRARARRRARRAADGRGLLGARRADRRAPARRHPRALDAAATCRPRPCSSSRTTSRKPC